MSARRVGAIVVLAAIALTPLVSSGSIGAQRYRISPEVRRSASPRMRDGAAVPGSLMALVGGGLTLAMGAWRRRLDTWDDDGV